MRASVRGGVRDEDRVAHVEVRGGLRRELHRAGHERFRDVLAQRPAELPERLEPDLAIRVHLGLGIDVAEVAVGEPPGAGRSGRRRAVARGAAREAVGVLVADPRAPVTQGATARSTAFVSSWYPSATSTSSAYQSLQPSPIAPD